MSIQVNEFDYQVLHLSNLFYSDYPNPPYNEMLKKDKRAYNCLLIQSCYGYFICIPYRSQISYKYAFLFKRSIRSRTHKSGLDYTKIIIIQNKDYLDDYIAHIKGDVKIGEEEFRRRYQFSTLKYFHKELGILEIDIAVTT